MDKSCSHCTLSGKDVTSMARALNCACVDNWAEIYAMGGAELSIKTTAFVFCKVSLSER